MRLLASSVPAFEQISTAVPISGYAADTLLTQLSKLAGTVNEIVQVVNSHADDAQLEYATWAEHFDALRTELNTVLADVQRNLIGYTIGLDAAGDTYSMVMQDDSLFQAYTLQGASAVFAKLTDLVGLATETGMLAGDDSVRNDLVQYADNLHQAVTTALGTTNTTAVGARDMAAEHSARHELGGADELRLDSRLVVEPVRDWVRQLLAGVQFAPARLVFLGDSHTNDGSYEQQPGADPVWGGGYGYAYRLSALLTAEGMGECQAGVSVTSNQAPGVHTWEAATGGMMSGTYVPQGTVDNLATIQPHVVFHMIGTNDFANQVPLATFKANVLSAISRVWSAVPGARQVLISPWPRINPVSVTMNWHEYVAVMGEIAQQYRGDERFTYLPWGQRWSRLGAPRVPNLWGVIPDHVHGNTSLHRELAGQLAGWLGLPDPAQVFSLANYATKEFRAGYMSDANPTVQRSIGPVAVPRLVTVTLLLLCDNTGEGDIKVTIGGEMTPVHVQPHALGTDVAVVKRVVPAHQSSSVVVTGTSGINVFAGAYDEYNLLSVDCEYV